jgi:hypothetical protein
MRWSLIDSEGTEFELANGVDRTAIVLASDSGVMQQQTPTTVYFEDTAPTAFLEQAVRSEVLPLQVTYPPCSSDAEAFLQARTVKASCPKGGILRGHIDGEGVEYGHAWVNDIAHERIGVTNRFTFNLTITRDAVKSWIADEEGVLLEDEDGDPLEY